jgi:hypothetical protein
MVSIASKVFIFVVLLAVSLMFTGFLTTASAIVHENSEMSCCGECSSDECQSPDHCSTQDCPMFLCLSINMVSPITVSIPTESVFIAHSVKELHLNLPAKPIFHPPVVV